MNYWTELSIEYANQRSYLDDLFQVYPTTSKRGRSSKQSDFNGESKLTYWLAKKSLGILPVRAEEFGNSHKDAILDGSKQELAQFARQELNYQRDKGLDLVARFNGKYVIGEAKLISDFSKYQNTQFNNTITNLETQNVNAIKIAILDGVLYIKGKNKMYKDITTKYAEMNILSALVLREFLYQI